MKTVRISAMILGLLSLIMVQTNCNKEKDEKPTIKMSVINSNPVPYQIVKLTITGTTFTNEIYNGQIGDVKIIALKSTADTLRVMIPYLKANNYILSIDIGEKMGIADITVRDQIPVTNQDQLINKVINGAKAAVTDLDKLAASNGQTINPESKTLLTNMVSSLNSAYTKLTAEEKKQFAQFINTNSVIFDSTRFSGSKGIVDELAKYVGYYRIQILKVGVSGAGFDLLTYAPDPVLKVAGFACGVYMIETVLETMSYTARLLLDDPVIPSPDGLLSGKAADFNFQNNKEKVLNVGIIYRTIYSGDSNTTNALLKQILGYLDQFQALWDKINGTISTIKNFFGFSDGNLMGKPAKISEISTFKTGAVKAGNAQYATITGITNTNVSVSVIGAASQLKVTFSSTQTTDQAFSFTCKYTEDGITLEKTYSATLSVVSPIATTVAASSISQTGATLNGTVNANNLSTTVTFEYGTTISYGQTINATPNAVSGSTNTNVSAALTGLTTGTTYHFRIKAVSSGGTIYGGDLSFVAQVTIGDIIFNPNLTYGTVSDIDGNTYKTIQIGSQTWMAENLKTTKYNDGTAIPNVTVDATWAALTTGAYSDNSNTPANSSTYGRLYNWYVVDNNAATKVANNGGKNVCPTSWHVSTDVEWTTLTTFLGEQGQVNAGNKLKETGTTHWYTNTGATNESGFTALPGGYRYGSGVFWEGDGYWWSSTEYSATNAYGRVIYYGNGGLASSSNHYKRSGYSVRCVKN